MEYDLIPDESQAGWGLLQGRPDLPPEVAQVCERGERMRVDEEAANRIYAWMRTMGWTDNTTPICVMRSDET